MDWKEAAGVIGALAWLPYLIALTRRPKVTIVVSETIEIGFTGMGPIFNPTLAFRGENKDSLIVGIEFIVEHERGARSIFRLTQLVDTAGTTQSTSGESAIHQRISQAIAVVVGQSSVAERKVCTRDAAMLTEYNRILNAYLAAARRQNHPAIEDRVRAARETAEAQTWTEFLWQHFTWQAGRYSVTCSVRCAGQSRVWTESFSFSLTEGQVQQLRANEPGIAWELRTVAFGPPPDGPRVFPWNWLYISRE